MRAVQKQDIRPPAVANLFYPGNPGRLNIEIDKLIKAAEPVRLEGEICALVSPHAGYPYSGQVAATGYRLLQDRE